MSTSIIDLASSSLTTTSSLRVGVSSLTSLIANHARRYVFRFEIQRRPPYDRLGQSDRDEMSTLYMTDVSKTFL
ncbi:hypothetical protein NMY22_g6548 [Coprinellus aureogranulatus]|nr:hypothetical protein NMY22_g6548 [Coprinellus aureogranulatus]